MKTCDTCKHFGHYNADGMYDPKSPAFVDFDACLNPKLGNQGTAIDDGCGSYAYNDHQTGQLKPGPKFGCVHWGAKK